jgi:anthranilate phosphoribosyltransferase
MTVRPADFGLSESPLAAIRGGDPAANARIIGEVLAGGKGPPRNAVLMNAAAAIVAAGLGRDLVEGCRVAAESIDSGEAMARLEGLKALSER